MPRSASFWHWRNKPLLRLLGASGRLSSSLSPNKTRSNTVDSGPRTIFSGIQPTGVPHLGNYLGALHEWVKLQDESNPQTRLIFSLVDLHAITVRPQPAFLRQSKRESLAVLLAIGLDPSQCTIFHQSDVPAHAELMWILSCSASTGPLNRMTQWKDKHEARGRDQEQPSLGLYVYPVLQAADVLVHQATHVPVGEDQEQHLELARNLSGAFNHVYGNVLIPPQTLVSPAKRIMSLTNPMAKMSKSDPQPMSRILLTDSEDAIQSKLKSALTDSLPNITYDPVGRPGVSNLIDIIYHCMHATARRAGDVPASQEDLARELDGTSFRLVKEMAANVVNDLVRPIRARYSGFISDGRLLERVAADGADKARVSAANTIKSVRDAVGLS